MTKDDYIKGVMQRMNELGWDDSFAGAFVGSDTTKVERHIEASFADAWRKSVGLLPRNYFNQESFNRSFFEGDISTGTGFVVLPDDFYVLSLFKMRGWKKDCFVALEENDAIAAVQSNDYVRVNFCRPVCVISTHPRHGRILKYYSLPKGNEHRIDEALYIPLIKDIEKVKEFKDILYEPLQWISAGVVFSIFEKADVAKMADEKAIEVVNIV